MTDTIEQVVAISGDRNIVTGTGNVNNYFISPAEENARRDLGNLLKNFETTWIKGVLQKSVYDAVLLDLGMESRTDVVAHPWRLELERPDQERAMLSPEKTIKEIFYETNRRLPILGEPGSGKTTTLLQLARDLMVEVDEAFTHPVPVIFNLITWTNQQQPIDKWLIAELNSPKYGLPPNDGRRYLEEGRILPLLDGLDEVKLENRASCIEKINWFVRNYGLQGMVVCSRLKDYTDLDVRLTFYGAIYLQPLTAKQIDQYFDRFGIQLASLRTTLKKDEALRSLAQSPLILNIMSLAYQNTSAETLSDPALATDEARRHHLFDAYIARMFKRRQDRWPYDDEQTRQRLSWLARNMQRHNQEIFLIEGLQPSWLQTRRWQWIYTIASRFVVGAIVGLLLALIGLIILNMILTEPGEKYLTGPLMGLIFGLSVGITGGLIDGLRFAILRFEWLRKRLETSSLPPFWWSIAKVIVVWLSIGLVLRLYLEMISGLSDESPIVLSPGVFGGLSYPQVSIYDNMGFELKLRKTPKAEIDRRVKEVADILDFAELLDRKPRELSTEQLRRVALGRAIVREPAAFLFDKFLSDLDADLHGQFSTFLSKLHQRLATTFIYATQDQTEALALATRIAVMRDGVLQQVDSPLNLYHHPDNMFVAGSIGAPAMNFFNGSITGSLAALYVKSGSVRLKLPQNLVEQLGEESINKEVIFGIRPQDIYHPQYQSSEVVGQTVEAWIDGSELKGNETCVSLWTDDDQSFIACLDSRADVRRGDEIRLVFNAEKVHIFDAITEKNIATPAY